MARKRHSSRASGPSDFYHYVITPPRDTPSIASTWAEPSRPVLRWSPLILPRSGRSLQAIEDRRTFNPDPYRPAAALRSPRHRLLVGSLINAMGAKRPRQAPRSGLRLAPGFGVPAVPAHVRFRGANSVLVCVRRRRRREALFARSRIGRRGMRLRRPRWSAYSSVSCRRS